MQLNNWLALVGGIAIAVLAGLVYNEMIESHWAIYGASIVACNVIWWWTPRTLTVPLSSPDDVEPYEEKEEEEPSASDR
jgi:hypothetical protein